MPLGLMLLFLALLPLHALAQDRHSPAAPESVALSDRIQAFDESLEALLDVTRKRMGSPQLHLFGVLNGKSPTACPLH